MLQARAQGVRDMLIASALRATDKCSVMDPLAGLVPRGKVGF
jgi:hypothetical protein